MQKFTVLKAKAAPMPRANIDTDLIIPKQFLKTIQRSGLGKNLFNDLRYDEQGNERDDFVLNQEAYRHANILVTGENFGCGSSREHAPWSLLDFGIQCVIAESFADIFYNNCFKNGILPIKVSSEDVEQLMQAAENKENEFNIDLEQQSITVGNHQIDFEIDAFRKHCLLNGLDDIGLTLQNESAIQDFEQKRTKQKAWL